MSGYHDGTGCRGWVLTGLVMAAAIGIYAVLATVSALAGWLR